MNHDNTKKTTRSMNICSDCRSTNNLQVCNCSRNHFLCRSCLTYSNKRAVNNTFYSNYRGWCDACIWFDMG